VVSDDRAVTAQSRQFPRYAVAASVELRPSSGDPAVLGRTRNVSRGGLCAATRSSVRIGADVEARITLVFKGGAVSEPLVLPMRIVWCTAMGSEFQVGCSFLGVTAEQRQYLEVFLKYLEEGAAAEEAEAGEPREEEDPFTD
jgi:hypothetical protein